MQQKSKWSKFDAQITELIQEYESNSEIAKILLNTSLGAKKNKDVDLLRTYIKRFRNRGIRTALNSINVDHKTAKHLWHEIRDENDKKIGNAFIKNPDFKEQVEKNFDDVLQSAIKSIDKHLKDKVKPIEVDALKVNSNALFDTLIITDVHIGMNPNPNGYSLYGGKWDEQELNERLEIVLNEVVKNQKSNKLVIFELGDFMDGWDGETVRKGHKLPQNMDNEKAFDVGLTFKIKLIDTLVHYFSEIEVYNICEDNHAGSFGYVVNSAFKKFIELRYNNVNVVNQRKFIDHYVIDNKCFIATHGKDGHNLKFGFKPILDPRQVEKIDNYIRENKLFYDDIYFIKGDSHQDIFDNSTSQHFNYWNFPAFSPSSNWVQTNFKKGISGFYFLNFYKDTYSKHPYYFKWKN